MRKKHQVFAVLRADEFHAAETAIETNVTVKQVVSAQQIAEREIERLTRLNAKKRCRYWWQATRFVALPEESSS